MLTTSGQGMQSLSRTFISSPGATVIHLRYRFITREVPEGWFGSRFNDYYFVKVRSQQGGKYASECNSMNGLGLPPSMPTALRSGLTSLWK